MASDEDYTLLACELQEMLDQNGARCHGAAVVALLGRMRAALAAAGAGASNAFYGSWPTLARALGAADASPAVAGAALRLVEAAAGACNPRELLTVFLEYLSQDASPPDGHGDDNAACPNALRTQLRILALMPGLLLRIQRRWLAFLRDYLNILLRWGPRALLVLPWSEAVPALEAATAAGLPSAALPAVVDETAGSLASLAAFVLGTPQQQQQPAPSLTAADRAAAAALLLQAGLQLASLLAQLPLVQRVAEGRLQIEMAAGPALMGRKLESIGPAAASVLQLPATLLEPLLRLLPAPPSAEAQLRVAEEYAAQEELRQAQRAQQGSEEGSDDDEEDADNWLSSGEISTGAALALLAAVLHRDSHAPAAAGERPASLPLQLPDGGLPALLPELAPAVQLVLDLGAQHKSAALVVLALYCLSEACRTHSNGGEGGGPAVELGGKGLAAARRLVAVLTLVMSYNPVEAVRSCAHEALQAMLDALPPEARLELLRGLLESPSGAAVVVGLQRLRQEVAAALGAHDTGSPFLSQKLLQAATESFRRGGGSQRWGEAGDVLANADAMAAALALYRFLLLRQQAAQAPGPSHAAVAAVAAGSVLLSAQSVRSTLRDDLLPLQAVVAQLLQLQGRSMGAGLTGESLPGPASPRKGVVGGQAAMLEGWLSLQRLLDVLERVIELARGW